MKKLSIIFAISLISLASYSQAPKQKVVVLQLTPEGIDLLLKGLAELPAKESLGLINYLQQQAQAQLSEQAKVAAKDTTAKKPVVDKPKEKKP